MIHEGSAGSVLCGFLEVPLRMHPAAECVSKTHFLCNPRDFSILPSCRALVAFLVTMPGERSR